MGLQRLHGLGMFGDRAGEAKGRQPGRGDIGHLVDEPCQPRPRGSERRQPGEHRLGDPFAAHAQEGVGAGERIGHLSLQRLAQHAPGAM